MAALAAECCAGPIWKVDGMTMKTGWTRAGRSVALAALFLGLMMVAGRSGSASAPPAAPLTVVASFSILADMVHEVGGPQVRVVTLVGPDGDAHVYHPSPADARTLATADLVFINGLGFEPWFERLRKASASKATVVVASQGLTPQTLEPVADPHASGHRHDDDHAGAGRGDHTVPDPHAWQNLRYGIRYVTTIAQALAAARPEEAAGFQERAEAYKARLMALDAWVRTELEAIPVEERKVITGHDAFGYFARAYDIRFIAPLGLNTEAEATPKGVARLIRQMKAEKIRAVFLENMTDPRLVQQMARDGGGVLGGALYADALSPPQGPAATYEAMFRHNVATLKAALQRP